MTPPEAEAAAGAMADRGGNLALIRNGCFENWGDTTGIRPLFGASLVPHWEVEYSPDAGPGSVSFLPASSAPASAGLKVVVTRPVRWIRVQQTLTLPSGDEGQEVALVIGGLKRQSAQDALLVSWVALLANGPANHKAMAQLLVRSPMLRVMAEDVSRRVALRPNLPRTVVIAVQFAGGAGTVQLGKVEAELINSSRTRGATTQLGSIPPRSARVPLADDIEPAAQGPVRAAPSVEPAAVRPAKPLDEPQPVLATPASVAPALQSAGKFQPKRVERAVEPKTPTSPSRAPKSTKENAAGDKPISQPPRPKTPAASVAETTPSLGTGAETLTAVRAVAVDALPGTRIVGGLVDVTPTLVSGWAVDPARPGEPVVLDLVVDGLVAARAVCNRPAGTVQLDDAVTGDCVFQVPTPAALLDGVEHVLRVVPTNLIGDLPGSPRSIRLTSGPLATKPGQPAALTPDPRGVAALHAFARLAGLEVRDVAHVVYDGPKTDAAWQDAKDPGVAVVRTLHESFAAGRLCIVDAWLANTGTLRLRVQPEPGEGPSEVGALAESAVSLRLFQADPASGRIISIGVGSVGRNDFAVVDAALVNPYAPVLITARSVEGHILGVTLLPFPSLCRGGPHEAELALLAQSGTMLADVRCISDGLLREACGLIGPPAMAIGAIEVDLSGSIGTERIFSASFQDWLAHVAKLRVAALPGSSLVPEARAHLEAALGRSIGDARLAAEMDGRRAAAPLVLRLPGDALPSLSAVFSRRLGAVAPGTYVCGVHAIADPVTCRPSVSVAYPPMDEALMQLQPRHSAIVPHLASAGAPFMTGRTVGIAAPAAELPLAIRFPLAAPASDAFAVRRSSPDSPDFPLRLATLPVADEGIAVSAALSGKLAPREAVMFLETLASQSLGNRIEVLCPAYGHDPEAAQLLATCLGRLFPHRHRLLPDTVASPSVALNAAVAAAQGAAVLVVSEPILLIDPRVVEVLLALMGDARAATTSCTLAREVVRARGELFAVGAGGIFPSHINCVGLPRLIFKELEEQLMQPAATYPVVGNSGRFLLVRRSAWKQLGGLDAERFPNEHADIEFALRAIRAGWRHLNTSAVSAVALAPRTSREILDPVGSAFLPPLQWQEIAASSTIVWALR